MEAGAIIKQLRLERGLTLEQLGDLVGVGKSTIRKWENGMIENMKRDKIQKLADALNVSPLTFINAKEDDNARGFKEFRNVTLGDKQYRRLWVYFDKLSDDGKNKVMERVDELIKLEGKDDERKEDGKR